MIYTIIVCLLKVKREYIFVTFQMVLSDLFLQRNNQHAIPKIIIEFNNNYNCGNIIISFI